MIFSIVQIAQNTCLVLACCMARQYPYNTCCMALLLYNTTTNTTKRHTTTEKPRPRGFCAFVALCNTRLVVVLYCIVILLRIQYNTTNTTPAIQQYNKVYELCVLSYLRPNAYILTNACSCDIMEVGGAIYGLC